ncbi:hypothetical protein [Cryobacterium breve]|uniref:hypothetical protein n=1 Tax=Cryobacterium breve TaxID=1259258 RepID=UPI00248D3751|nr:hypothetical protein [Cryobacterium breve]
MRRTCAPPHCGGSSRRQPGWTPTWLGSSLRQSARLLHNFSQTATALRDRHALRSGLSDHEAAAAIWALAHPQVYRSLVLDLDWSVGAYREWLANTLRATLF